MGYPATDNLEKLYRNSMTDIQQFFRQRHPGCYKVYNLCSEKHYDPSHFDKVAKYPFDDHNPPKIQQIYDFCNDVVFFS